MELFKVGFVTIRLVDIIDVSVVTFLFYKLYELLRGSLAFRIFLALGFVFLIWKLVDLLDMLLLKSILDEFLGVGAIALIVIFSSEIRRFLLLIGKNSIISKAWQQLFMNTASAGFAYNDLINAIEEIKRAKLGALIVLAGGESLEAIKETGDLIGAAVSERVLHSFFLKDSPLHDGAVIIENNQIAAARCVLPISKSTSLPPELGLRHRAAMGISEISDVLVLVVSEERQEISIVTQGKIDRNVDLITLEGTIRRHLDRSQVASEEEMDSPPSNSVTLN